MLNDKDSKAFLKGYLECALWASTNDDGEYLDEDYEDSDIAWSTAEEMVIDCDDFCEVAADIFDRVGAGQYQDFEKHGYDFWLTRNGHGTGYWDRGYGDDGDALSKMAENEGAYHLYVGDDNLVHGYKG